MVERQVAANGEATALNIPPAPTALSHYRIVIIRGLTSSSLLSLCTSSLCHHYHCAHHYVIYFQLLDFLILLLPGVCQTD